MPHELLTPAEMGEADRLTIAAGAFDGMALMRNAGAAVAAAALQRFPGASPVHVLCGPGNNGGDGYVAARLLHEAGVALSLFAEGLPRAGTDAGQAAAECPVAARPLGEFAPGEGSLVIDALFGAGLAKPVAGAFAEAIDKAERSGARVLAVDLPSGVSGASGAVLGTAFRADLTVTFFRRKPGHVLEPGRSRCGAIVLADIGIEGSVLERLRPACFENDPALWAEKLPRPAVDAHKYARGHACVFSGGPSATGAAQLAALAAARAGAGAVTVLSPASALLVNAAHLTAIMLRRIDTAGEVADFAAERRPTAFVLGPGFGVGERTRDIALTLLRPGAAWHGVVLDADAITSFRDEPRPLYEAAGAAGAPSLVLTPHAGEFARLFPDLAGDRSLSKLDAARAAARRANAVLVYKGPDTVIAAPDGRAAINANGTPYLATAGSGDVLAGLVAGLLAQGMPAFEAAAAAVFIHAEVGRRFGPGLIAEDLPALLPAVLGGLLSDHAG